MFQSSRLARGLQHTLKKPAKSTSDHAQCRVSKPFLQRNAPQTQKQQCLPDSRGSGRVVSVSTRHRKDAGFKFWPRTISRYRRMGDTIDSPSRTGVGRISYSITRVPLICSCVDTIADDAVSAPLSGQIKDACLQRVLRSSMQLNADPRICSSYSDSTLRTFG
ncbi:hypothetical protein EVAR_22589_1 [Eumeta japonica]|uniref:Uncharacterized protein n=1 Tax=Eumeta variegata TaxID=151549 RepID=A0A4C1U7C3_EUMVA|nr:hypothetical protein EVAR_22589_1 [Eumeta japonica]